MMDPTHPHRPVVVDTNVLFSALLAPDTRYARVLLTDQRHEFFICETVVIEMFEHRDKLLNISKLSLPDLLVAYHLLMRRLTLYKELLISESNRQRAVDLCAAIDPEDVMHVALALELNAPLWTGDKRLRDHLLGQGFVRFFTVISD